MSTEYDALIERFSLSYPNIEPSQPQRLWNYNRYGLSNYAHLHSRKPNLQDYSKRAEELELLPSGIDILSYFIDQVNEKYKDKIPSQRRLGKEGSYQSIVDLEEARAEIIQLINPYLTRVLVDTDFTRITERFSGGTSTDRQVRQFNEPKERRKDFREIVLEVSVPWLKTNRQLFENFLQQRKDEWDPRTILEAWYLTGTIHFDFLIRIGNTTKFSSLNKVPVQVLDFDEKWIGQYGIVPQHQWAKKFVYEAGDSRFVFLEKEEWSAANKGINDLIGQPLIFRTTIPNYEKLYPYDFDENSLEYDGKYPKTNLHEHWVYIRKFDQWIWNENEITDSTADYRVDVVEVQQ